MTEDAAKDMDSEGGGQAPLVNGDDYNSIGRAKTGSTNVWITPEYIIKWVDKEFGPIGLDAAADVDNSVAPDFIDEKMDALVTPWISDDVVWCNPPYGKEAKKFVERAIDQVTKKNCKKVVMLLAVRTDTKMFQELIFSKASRIHFIKGRVKFKRVGKTRPDERPNFASAIVVFSDPLPDPIGLGSKDSNAFLAPYITYGPVI
jgi:phage N-6-adenine-methyltransferase